tara:strand:- start:1707 stop:1841 length:135 start_codon:yes stop_codon:yes gene_type:complete
MGAREARKGQIGGRKESRGRARREGKRKGYGTTASGAEAIAAAS